MKRIAFCIALMMMARGSLRADAWPRGRDGFYVHVGTAAMNATTAFDPSGQRIPFPGRGGRERRTTAYLELGLTDRFTLVASAPYERITSRGLFNDFTTTGLADLDLRLRASTTTRAGVLAIEGGAFVPLGYRRNDFPQLGSGRVDPIVNLAYGTSFRPLPEGFATVQLGYRFRGGEISDEIPYSAKLGTFLWPRIGTFVFIRGWQSRGDFRNADPTFGLIAADSERLAAGTEIYLRATRSFDLNITWSRVGRGRNTAIGDEFAIGVAVHSR